MYGKSVVTIVGVCVCVYVCGLCAYARVSVCMRERCFFLLGGGGVAVVSWFAHLIQHTFDVGTKLLLALFGYSTRYVGRGGGESMLSQFL